MKIGFAFPTKHVLIPGEMSYPQGPFDEQTRATVTLVPSSIVQDALIPTGYSVKTLKQLCLPGFVMHLDSHDYVQTLKGQKLRFPNFDYLVRDWPKGHISPHYEVLRQVHNEELKKLLGPGPRYDALVAVDCAYLACTWWPHATFDALRLPAHHTAFLYVWDDEIDSPEFSTMSYDWDRGIKFREVTKEHIKRYLDNERLEGTGSLAPVDTALLSFNPVGETSAFRLTRGQRNLFFDELIRYVNAVGEEQRVELSGNAPPVEEYLDMRMGTSAVATITASLEYMLRIDLGDRLRNDPDIKVIFDEINFVISLMNDAFSLRRELKFPFYCNVVAVLYHQHRDLQTAVDETYKLVAQGCANLEAAGQRALQRYPQRREDIQAFIVGAKEMITGNMAWSMHIKRYHLGVPSFDGSTEITI